MKIKDISELISYNIDGSALILRDMIDKYLNIHGLELRIRNEVFITIKIEVVDSKGKFVDTIRIPNSNANGLTSNLYSREDFENYINKRKRLFAIDKILNT